MAVFQRGNYFHYEFMYLGETYRKSCGKTCKSRTRALQIEADARAKAMLGEAPAGRKAPLLREFAENFIAFVDASEELKPKSKLGYKNGWRLLSATPIANMRIDRIGMADAAVLTFPGGPSNANQALRTLRRMLGFACECRVMRTAPRIKLREEEGREATIAPWLEGLLIEFASPILRDVITIMLDCGMRPDEVSRMQWGDVRWAESRILVQRGKSKSARRYVGLTERMSRVLTSASERNKRLGRESEWVFPTRAASGHIGNFSNVWARTVSRVENAIDERKLPPLPDGLVLYSARHTFATQFLKNGGDLGTLMVLMGHTDIRTTQKYLHASTEGAADVMNRHNATKLEIVKRRA